MNRNVLGGKAACCCVVLLGIACPALAAKPHYELTGRVVAIADGDTLTVLDETKAQHKIRLAVFKQPVRVEVIDVDRYKREVGRIYLGDRFINMEMVADGFAWRYPQYDKPGEFTAAENDSREHQRGLWADKDPVPPWEWRKAKRRPATPQPGR